MQLTDGNRITIGSATLVFHDAAESTSTESAASAER
jgi:hypothetical protein